MIIAAIPARAGSKSIPDKNIVDIGGKPALAYSIQTALDVPEIDRVVVSTNSFEYIEIASMYGADVFRRSEHLAQDDSTDLDWLKEFKDSINVFPMHYDTIVILRPTTPLRRPEVVSEAIRKFREYYIADSIRSVHEMSESAFKCFTISKANGDYLLPIGTYEDCVKPRQKVRPTYHPNGYVDIIHASNLYNDTVYGTKILAFITPRTTEIDSIEDLEYIRWEVSRV